MLITITGQVTEKLDQSIVLEVAGLGYQISVSRSDFETIPTGQETRLYLHEIIREDAHDLFGFSGLDGRKLFQQLLSVSGVGPKAAMAILSAGRLEQVSQSITNGDVAFLQLAQGIGKRTAERIVLELKNKLAPVLGDGVVVSDGDTALQALIALGYPSNVAAQALSGIPSDIQDEERIKQALRGI